MAGMAFVHGHARATGWVMAHRRAPNRPEEGQLELLPAVVRIPSQRRRSPEPVPAAAEQAIARL